MAKYTQEQYSGYNVRQKALIASMRAISQATGTRVVLEHNITRETVNADGIVTRQQVNGYYDNSDGSIHLSMSIIDSGVMTYAAYEFTHLIR